jgi:ketosteroid isomerase-like protein
MITLRATFAALALPLIIGAGVARAQPADGPLGQAQVAPADTPAGRVATTFYRAFCTGDIATLERLYAPDVAFKDEIFTFTNRTDTIGMWRVLLAPSGGGKFSAELLGVDGDVATVRWLADYKFPATGRPVHNVVTARMVVRGGRIVDHHDSFSWPAWSRQAFPLGVVSTWRPVEWVIKASMRAILARSARAANEAAAKAAAQAAPAPAQGAPSKGITDRLGGS